MLYIDDAGESDPIGYDIYMIRNNIGPNFWTDEAFQNFGDLSMCIIDCYRKSNPTFSGYYLRYLTTLLAMQQFEQVTIEMKANSAEKIEVQGEIGDFYAHFTERYVGYGQIEKGLDYLLSVISTYSVNQDNKEYWTKLFERLLDDSIELDEIAKTRVREKIKRITK
jgi:uncharacterized protein (UPF0297 family)